MDGERHICPICPRHCALAEGQTGACRARVCRDGVVTAGNYGRITSIALDPIEKKPLYGFHPGSRILSLGSYGCNLHCPWCQNDSISQVGEGCDWESWTPEQVVGVAKQLESKGSIGIAYTYNEPFISYEFVRDCGQLAHEAGLANVLVSNGMICCDPLEGLLPLIDAANIDIKGPDQDFYQLCGGDYDTVWSCVEMLQQAGCHVELTTLVIPGLNDSDEAIDGLASRIAALDPNIIYHLSRFFPCYRMKDRPITPRSTMYRLEKAAKKHLTYVTLGNM